MATWGDWIGLLVFLAVTSGMGYAAYLVPRLLNPPSKTEPQEESSKRPKISRTSSGIKIQNISQMDADRASYNMVKGGRDMAKKIKATNAVSFGRRDSGADTLQVPNPQP